MHRCPLWSIANRVDGKITSDYCSPGCQLYIREVNECTFKVIAEGIINAYRKGAAVRNMQEADTKESAPNTQDTR